MTSRLSPAMIILKAPEPILSPTVARDLSLSTLNTFLRDEIAAVQTYARTLARLGGHACCADLGQCLASHERRVVLLRRRIVDLGGVPAKTPGAWDPFPRHGESGSGSVPLRDDAVIAALEEGEDRGLKLYLEAVGKLDRDTRRLIGDCVLPEQVWTHDSLSDLSSKSNVRRSVSRNVSRSVPPGG